MNLYVWICNDDSTEESNFMVVAASNLEEARRLALDKLDNDLDDEDFAFIRDTAPDIYETPRALYL
jgi:hypothetical protein